MAPDFDKRFEELRRRFLERCPEQAEQLREALREDDCQRIAHIAHAISGTAGILGFAQLSALARELERTATGPAQPELVCTRTKELVAAMSRNG